jgi:ATP-dependent Clp protease ATP-binding subunit ClpB
LSNFLITGGDALAAKKGFRLVGRKEKFDELCTLLTQSSSDSVIVSGPAGVGITAMFYGLQARKADPDAPYEIVNKRLFQLDTDGLFALGDNAQIAKHFKDIFAQLNDTPDSILFVEDTMDLIKALTDCGMGWIVNALNSLVKRRGTQVFLEVREDDLTKLYKTHSDFLEHYTLLDLKEASGAELNEIVDYICEGLESHYSVRISPEARQVAVALTSKYRAVETGLASAQPKRAYSLLDRTMSRYCRQAHSTPAMLPELEAQLAKLSRNEDSSTNRFMIAEVMSAIERHKKEFAERQAKIKKCYTEIRNSEKSIDKLKAERTALIELETHKFNGKERVSADEFFGGDVTSSPEIERKESDIRILEAAILDKRAEHDSITKQMNDHLRLTGNHVYQEFSKLSDIEETKLRQDDRVRLINLGGVLKGRIVGQDQAVEMVYDAVKVWKRGRRTGQPLPFLLLGPSGVGKTEVARSLAVGLHDTESAMNKFDMGEYGEKNDVTKLIGAPPGYEGFEVGGQMTESARTNPMQIMLMDEVEKAHKMVFNIFLGILDEGYCKDNIGRRCDFADIIMPFTSNLGQEHMLRVGKGENDISEQDAEELTMRDVEGFFKPEFLNRFNGRENIIILRRLELPSMQWIAHRELKRINQFYAPNIKVEFPDDALEDFCLKTYTPKLGARGIPGKVKHIEKIIVDQTLNDDSFKGILQVGYNQSGFTSEWMQHAAQRAA